MDKKIYLHGINASFDNYNSRETIKKLKSILESKALLSLRKQEKAPTLGFNGMDYISLCDYEKKDLFNPGYITSKENLKYNAYNGYIKQSLSLVFPKEKFEVITPEIIDISIGNRAGYKQMAKLGESLEKRYSDMPDEVQVKDSLSLELMTAITLPLHKMNKPFHNEKKTIDLVLEEIYKIQLLLNVYGYDVPLFDIESFESITDETNVKKLVKEYYKKYRGC